MEAKSQDWRKWIVVAVLMPVAGLVTVRSILDFEAPAQIIPKGSTREIPIDGASGKEKGSNSVSLDPTLHYAQLERTENARYEGSGRNIFRVDLLTNTNRITPAPAPTPHPVEVVQPQVPTSRLRFFGFALIFNSPRKVFLSEGDAIFIGSEGEVIDRRYRIGRIGSNSVEVEDLIDHSVHTLSLAG